MLDMTKMGQSTSNEEKQEASNLNPKIQVILEQATSRRLMLNPQRQNPMTRRK